MEILRKNQKEMLEIKNIVIEMKNIFVGLIKWLDMAEERISELEYISIETSKTEKERTKTSKMEQSTKGLWGNSNRYNIHTTAIQEEKDQKNYLTQ